MDRPALIAAIKAVRDEEFLSEVDHFVNNVDDREYEYDEVSALFDISERAEEGEYANSRRLLTICRRLLIDAGYYYAMTPKQVANTYRSHGPAWDFKLDKTPYTSDECAEDWRWPEGAEA